MRHTALPTAAAAELQCPECKTPCITFRDHWYCSKCLRRVVVCRETWVCVSTPEYRAVKKYGVEHSCLQGGGHLWSAETLRFAFLNGVSLQMPVGHLTCRQCGATIDADLLFRVMRRSED